MKTKKINLNDLKINSFVTSLNEEKAQTVQGGISYGCSTHIPSCFECTWPCTWGCPVYDTLSLCKQPAETHQD